MLYSQADRDAAIAARRKRRLAVWLPTALVEALAIAVFVWFRLRHDETGWWASGLLTFIGGAYCIFFYGTYLWPVKKYKQHLDYMLDGRKRVTEGILREIAQDVQDHEGIDCYSVVINVGGKNDPEDDRQFYLDALKSITGFQAGDRVRVESNDRMIANVSKL